MANKEEMIKRGWKCIKSRDFITKKSYDELTELQKELGLDKLREVIGKEPRLNYEEWLKTADADKEIYLY